MNKLSSFTINDVKYFKFTVEQYVLLEIEYNRYIMYNELIETITHKILLFNKTLTNIDIKRKLYEHKNIIDRFVLESINHGITPITNTDTNTSDAICIKNLVKYLFFNKTLADYEELNNSIFYKKMVSEYREKNIILECETLPTLENIIVDFHIKFTNIVNKINELNAFQTIKCSILLTDSDNYIITYRNYSKVINIKRYARLIKHNTAMSIYNILIMIMRYAIFDTSNQQWSIGINLYEDISKMFNINFEMFASPLNFNMDMFCSLFLDTDNLFGSVGSFYNLSTETLITHNITGVIFNPPYSPILMNHTTKMCIKILENMDNKNIEFTVISFLPNWADAEYIKSFIHSKYVVNKKIINKGNYMLHEKDKGKLIKGTFELLVILMNSKQNRYSSSRKQYLEEGFKNIVNIMKSEIAIPYTH